MRSGRQATPPIPRVYYLYAKTTSRSLSLSPKKRRYAVGRPTASELDAMSHAEFKRRYVTERRLTPEDTQSRVPDEWAQHDMMLSEMPYIRTWSLNHE